MKVAVFRHPSQALLEAALDALRPDCVQTDVEDFDQIAGAAELRAIAGVSIRSTRDVAAALDRRPVSLRERAQRGR
jgi:hypothetical protein